jgi:uncharacterized protein YdeI (YjbR/CyaY-like superfamily)
MWRDSRIDDYVARQAPFAQPILVHLREAVHAACPGVEETIKWSMPAFLHARKQLAGMAAFKAHASFSLWRGPEFVPARPAQPGSMGQFGRITALSDLPPPAELDALIRKAVALIDSGEKPARTNAAGPAAQPPPDLLQALAQNEAARSTFATFAPSSRREYVDWVLEAKRAETRAKRIAQAVEWLAQGKRRN